MTDEPIFIQRIISHYRSILKLDLNEHSRATLNVLVAEAQRSLAMAISVEEQIEGSRTDDNAVPWAAAALSEFLTVVPPTAEIFTFPARESNKTSHRPS